MCAELLCLNMVFVVSGVSKVDVEYSPCWYRKGSLACLVVFGDSYEARYLETVGESDVSCR